MRRLSGSSAAVLALVLAATSCGTVRADDDAGAGPTGRLEPVAALLARPAPAASERSPGLRPLRPGRPPRNDAGPDDLVVTELYVTTAVDSDLDGTRDVVRVVVTRPRKALVDGRRLAVVAQASPYFSCCKDTPNHDVDVPLGQARGPRPEVYDGFLAGIRTVGAQWARRGYAFMRIASLGSNRSTGCPTVGDGLETAGVKAAVDWLNGRATGRLPGGTRVAAGWSTGNVGLAGVSYEGTLPNMVAATGVEGLRAIVPISAISSWYDYYRQDGLVVAPGGYQGEDTDVLAEFDYTRPDQRICDRVIDRLERQQDRRTGDYSRFWAQRDVRRDADRVRAGVLIAHGFGDDNVKPDQAARWYAALKRAGVPVKIWWDQGGHGTPLPERLQVRWFDHFLYGEGNGVASGPRAAVTHDGPSAGARWYADWPRPGSALRRWSLGQAKGPVEVLRPGAQPGRGRLRFTDDASLSASKACREPVRAHALTFRSSRLAQGLDLSGSPVARLRLAFGRTAANVTAALCVTAPDGGSRLLTQGFADPQNIRSLWRGEPLVPGRSYPVRVRLQPLDQRLPDGSRVSLVVMSSDHDFTLRPPAGTPLTLDLSRSSVSLPVVR
ncbi:Xaa-Pro dipeptidyl-peptidase [Nocardioides marinquilinus]|uniref:Xaa-Pro dipeptidyl-peptidase n=1 Tax=Nocardioides marinquilinus TaxID=1210400 RepID=A0ABP9PPP3_9ACTN